MGTWYATSLTPLCSVESLRRFYGSASPKSIHQAIVDVAVAKFLSATPSVLWCRERQAGLRCKWCDCGRDLSDLPFNLAISVCIQRMGFVHRSLAT